MAAPLTAIDHPILFVTQVPHPGDFTTIASTFGNHRGQIDSAPRGGDLWIRYPDGTLKNLTRAAGLRHGRDSRARTRSPCASRPCTGAARRRSSAWSSARRAAVPVERPYYWQIYEITGLGQTRRRSSARSPNQPANYNNVSPIYGTDDRILFTSDRPRNGARISTRSSTSTRKRRPSPASGASIRVTGDLRLLNHAPSGVFSPFVDSFGRVSSRAGTTCSATSRPTPTRTATHYGTFDYADESANAARLNQRVEVFPEPRSSRTDLLAGTNLEGLSINHFFPWEINEDGTAEETLNHIGRHELHGYFNRSFNDDDALVEFIDDTSGRFNQNESRIIFQIAEDPRTPGRYFGIDAPEFETHAVGQIVSLDAEPTRPADQIEVT